ncbi:hypothetical protein LP420_04370 [Massilia sp. B-10]|nr:hypothetical protein LP420_04370 [Massilia sp. B-10]UUZ57550.1 hypothetical protein LP419_04120 [Massilia sp. H-1]
MNIATRTTSRMRMPAGESYLPEGMAEPRWYEPVPRGIESKIAEKLAWLRSLDADAGLE